MIGSRGRQASSMFIVYLVNASTNFDFRFLYTFVACMDANFRLKNQLVSNYSVDPGLGTGWAYMVDRKPYEKYVLSRANEEDVCV